MITHRSRRALSRWHSIAQAVACLRALPLLSLLFLLSVSAHAAPGGRPLLHGLFTDNMILQREVPCPVWGWTDPGDTVTVTFAGQTKTATADPDGKWLVRLDPMPASAESRDMTLQIKADTRNLTPVAPPAQAPPAARSVTLKNIVVGDVWVCSGQSNMEFGLNGVDQWWNEQRAAEFPLLRLYSVPQQYSFGPLDSVSGRWQPSSAGSVSANEPIWGGFSAIGFMFARMVHRETGVPIGMIASSQGNTAIEHWGAVTSLGRFEAKYQGFDPVTAYADAVTAAWKAGDPAYAATLNWSAPDCDDKAWPTLAVPGNWRQSALPDFNGVVWFRKTIDIPATWAGKDLWLSLGPIDVVDTTWFNGTFVDAHEGRSRPRQYWVPGRLVTAGANLIALRISGERGFMGKPEQMGLLPANGNPAERIPLAGDWRYHASTPAKELKAAQPPRCWAISACHQGLIVPLAPFAIKGALWYQGEGNVGNSRNYANILTALIQDWRKLFGVGDFPFYIVQLANFGPVPAQPVNSGWATIREAQTQVARDVPNCGMAVAIDRGEIYNIHPPNKREVAERLAKVALAKTYGKNVPCEGPTYRAMQVEGGKIRIRFEHVAGLKSLGSAPAGFAIAGTDKKFVWAQGWLDGETVVVSAPEITAPVAVRYGWGDNAVCNLYNQDDLPAVPFRTDAW